MASVRRRWAAFETNGADKAPDSLVDLDALMAARTEPTTPRIAANLFLHQVTRALFPELIWVHGALLRNINGRVALVVGASGSGKSTLAALARAHQFDAPADDLVPVTAEFFAEAGIPLSTPRICAWMKGKRPEIIHLLDCESPTAMGAIFANSFNAWCSSPREFLFQLANRLQGIPVQRHPPLVLGSAEGRTQARATAEAILNSLRPSSGARSLPLTPTLSQRERGL